MRRSVAVAVLVVLLGACGTSPKPRYYALDSGVSGSTIDDRAAAFTVYVAEVAIPEAHDRVQFVARTSSAELAVLDQHRWAESLRGGYGRVIARQLGALLGSARVGSYPGTAVIDADYRVFVDVQRLDVTVGGEVVVEALWSVRRVAGGAPISGRSLGRAPASGGHDALPAAHVDALRTISADVAAAIARFASTKP